MWIAVNTVGAVLYTTQGLYFTALFWRGAHSHGHHRLACVAARSDDHVPSSPHPPMPEARIISVVGGESTGGRLLPRCSVSVCRRLSSRNSCASGSISIRDESLRYPSRQELLAAQHDSELSALQRADDAGQRSGRRG